MFTILFHLLTFFFLHVQKHYLHPFLLFICLGSGSQKKETTYNNQSINPFLFLFIWNRHLYVLSYSVLQSSVLLSSLSVLFLCRILLLHRSLSKCSDKMNRILTDNHLEKIHFENISRLVKENPLYKTHKSHKIQIRSYVFKQIQ